MATAAVPRPSTNDCLERSIWCQGGLMTFHLEAKDTDGTLAFLEISMAPGVEPPLHVHQHEDETFVVAEGCLKVTCGDEEFILEPGESAFVPRGVPHTFQILSRHARFMNYISPAGLEEFFRQMGRPAETLEPEPHPAVPDLARMISLGEKFGTWIV